MAIHGIGRAANALILGLLRAWKGITGAFGPPIHPADRRCSSLAYAGYARSSRLGSCQDKRERQGLEKGALCRLAPFQCFLVVHAAMNASHTADVLVEAFEQYLDWDVYRHQ